VPSEPLAFAPAADVGSLHEQSPSTARARRAGVRTLRALVHRGALDDYRPLVNQRALLEAVDAVKIAVSSAAAEALVRLVPDRLGRAPAARAPE
jgi:hypothetical protein